MTTSLRSSQVRDLGDKARELAKLAEHPSWATLRKEFEARKQTYLLKLARQIAAGGKDAAPLDQRELDYQRGFLRGAQAVLDTPDNAIEALEKALQKETA